MNEHLPTLLLQILLVGFTPGPANIYALTMSLRHGRKISLVMWLGMLVQLTNAKMLLFDLTVFSTFVLPYSDRLEDLFEAAAWLLIAGPGANLTWLMAGDVMRNFFLRYGRQVDHFSAIALVLCALYLLCF